MRGLQVKGAYSSAVETSVASVDLFVFARKDYSGDLSMLAVVSVRT